ncbi:MAG: pyridoxal phosphate-dependent aminotransferase [Ruminococcaceae bacterium]|nr:pyridoxal phosphate-dependent aminotransferase [Oscillospiraceae bacterium]
MISEKMKTLVSGSSAIRAMFEEGQRLAGIYGKENVYDFSLGNPSVPAPAMVKEAAIEILNNEDSLMVHGYMSNSGFEDVRLAIAKSLNSRFGTDYNEKNILMTVGAAGGLNAAFKAILVPGDEVITFAPFFGEYRNYVDNFGGTLVAVAPNLETFQPDIEGLRNAVTPKTKAVIINTPNNPTGVVYSEDTIKAIAQVLNEKQTEYGIDICLISDEPYRELAYDGVEVPWLPDYYDNTIVGYSFSKSLSLPGERIGYLVIGNKMKDFDEVVSGLSVAIRILGYVNAPSLMQRVVMHCLEEKSDVAAYDRNREKLYSELLKLGFECIKPQGAFYLFVKSPIADEKAFCNDAKKYNLLLVPGSSFGCPGYIRLAYCVSYDTIVNSIPAFTKLAADYGLGK